MGDPDPKSLVRKLLEQATGADGELGSMQESLPMLSAALEPLASPDFVCVMQPLPPTPAQTYEGVEGVAQAWSDYGGAFEDVSGRLEEVLESDDHMVFLVDQVARTRHGGVEISQPSAMLIEFDGGEVARMEFHLDRALALQRAGLGKA